MANPQAKHRELFDIEKEARRLRAEATAKWLKSFANWLRKPRALAPKGAGQTV